MPTRAFWVMSGFVERLLADEGKLSLEIAASAQGGDAAIDLFSRLEKQAPSPVKYTGKAMLMSIKRDEDAASRLAALAG